MSLSVLSCTGSLLPQEPSPVRPEQPTPAVASLHQELARPSVAVLRREFVERFDRSFLPTAQVVVP